MKRCSILFLIGFYLSLSTGIYACVIHCMEELVVKKLDLGAKLQDENGDHHSEVNDSEKTCDEGKDCNCCYKHGTYVVYENIKTTANDFRFLSGFIAIALFKYCLFLPVFIELNKSITWPQATGPPFISKKAIYITIRSLII